jgi:hypothetical protein
MKSLVLFFFMIGIVMIALGYQKKLFAENNKCDSENNKNVEIRYMPREIIEYQYDTLNLESNYQDMFDKRDVFMKKTLDFD